METSSLYGIQSDIRPPSRQKEISRPKHTEQLDLPMTRIQYLNKQNIKSVHEISFKDLDNILPTNHHARNHHHYHHNHSTNSRNVSPKESHRDKKHSECNSVRDIDPSEYYNYGNASEIGYRKGEQKILYET